MWFEKTNKINKFSKTDHSDAGTRDNCKIKSVLIFLFVLWFILWSISLVIGFKLSTIDFRYITLLWYQLTLSNFTKASFLFNISRNSIDPCRSRKEFFILKAKKILLLTSYRIGLYGNTNNMRMTTKCWYF